VLDVALREGDGLLGGMKPGSVLLVHATAPPQAVMDLDAAARRRGVHLIDAPVSGVATGAEAGTLTVLLGGDEAAIAKARPVLETFAANLLHVGAAGAAQRLKLLNNNLCYANVAMGLAALDLAQALGVDRAAAASVIRVSSGASHAFGLIVDPNQVAKMAGPTSNVRKDVDHLMALLATQGLDGGLLMAASCTAADRVSAYAQAGAPASP
jgi:3-hydroxyisobutyrate dehydrogenase-like beta-hydroxyacid dehydrogenase